MRLLLVHTECLKTHSFCTAFVSEKRLPAVRDFISCVGSAVTCLSWRRGISQRLIHLRHNVEMRIRCVTYAARRPPGGGCSPD
jgi:hypothetical protein